MKSVIIDRLIKIEENAQTITGGVTKKEAELPVMINVKCEEIERSLKVNYAEYARDVEDIKQRECDAALAEIEKDYAQRQKRLEQFYEQNHAEWEEELFNRIIGR